MSNFEEKWKNFLKEGSQWGGFTGGAAPLDEPTPDSGPIPPEQLRKMWSIYTEMGMSPEEILQTPEFVEAGIVSPEQLQEDCQDGYERVPGSVEFEQGSCREISEETRDTYGSEVVDRNKRSIKKGSKKMGLEERCQKGYKTHPTRKTKTMYGKTYRNCIKAEGEEKELEEAMDPRIKKLEKEYLRTKSHTILVTFNKLVKAGKYDKQRLFKLKKAAEKRNMSETIQDLDEKRKKKKKKKKAKKDDRCTRIAKRRYDVWPSAYASGAVVKCRDGKIWKGVSEGEEPGLEIKIRKALRDEGGAAGMDALVDHAEASEMEIKAAIKDMDDVGQHKNGDYILDDGEDVDILEDLRKWFGRKGEKGSTGGWVDCNAPDGDGGYKMCAQGDRKKKPACRPTPSACKEPGKGKKWGKKAAKEALDMKITKEQLKQIIFEETRQVYYEKIVREELDAVLDEKKKKKKKPCKPSKGKASAKRVDGKCRSYGQAGKAKDGGDRISRGTEKGDAYCARSAKIKKCKNPPCANALSRKAWGCQGDKSVA